MNEFDWMKKNQSRVIRIEVCLKLEAIRSVVEVGWWVLCVVCQDEAYSCCLTDEFPCALDELDVQKCNNSSNDHCVSITVRLILKTTELGIEWKQMAFEQVKIALLRQSQKMAAIQSLRLSERASDWPEASEPPKFKHVFFWHAPFKTRGKNLIDTRSSHTSQSYINSISTALYFASSGSRSKFTFLTAMLLYSLRLDGSETSSKSRIVLVGCKGMDGPELGGDFVFTRNNFKITEHIHAGIPRSSRQDSCCVSFYLILTFVASNLAFTINNTVAGRTWQYNKISSTLFS
jgi:hypothetical protein